MLLLKGWKMEENQIKEVKLVLGYDYYIVDSLLPQIVMFVDYVTAKKYEQNYEEAGFMNCISVKDYYREYIKKYTNNRNRDEQNLISVIYKNMPDCCSSDTFNFIKKDIKELFEHITNSTSYAIISKAKEGSGIIYFFKEQRELNEYRQKHDIKDKIFEDYCKIELSDKLLERLR